MAEPDWKSFFDMRVGERRRELLEDFEVIGTRQHLVIVQRGKYFRHLRENVRAAIVASTLRLQSIDYAKRRYCEPEKERSNVGAASEAYIEAYKSSKAYLVRNLSKLKTQGRPDPEMGIFGASLVLERLLPSFFCAHLLYSLGHGYEGHAVSRLILEQIAWAYAARSLDDMNDIEKIETTRSISALKRFYPVVGQMYGFLSKKTHIDYSSHHEFLRVEDGQNMLVYAQSRFDEYGRIILLLADIFGLVWEVSQLPYIDEFEAITVTNGLALPNPKRAFLNKIHEHIAALEAAMELQKAKLAAQKTNDVQKRTRRKRRAT